MPIPVLTKPQITEIFTRFAAKTPNPTTELRYHSPFELLIAVILSAQSTDKQVNKVTLNLFAAADSPQAMLELGEARVRNHIRSLGLFNNKARNIIAACALLVTRFGGKIPTNRAALESLPGVGRKTANVLLNTLWGQAVIAVDTHIFRVANRMGLAAGKTVRTVEDQLMQRIPKQFLQHAHHWLILHGRYVCKAQRPQCFDCPMADLCQFEQQKISHQID